MTAMTTGTSITIQAGVNMKKTERVLKMLGIEAVPAITEEDTKLVVSLEDCQRAMERYAEMFAEEVLETAAQKAEVCYFTVNDEGEEDVITGRQIYDDDYKYSSNFDSLPTFQVNEDSIRHIKLPKHE